MGNYSGIRSKSRKTSAKYACNGGAMKRYASGGRVDATRKGAKTVININTAPTPGMPAPGALPSAPPAPPMPSPAAAGPVPPQAAAMALNAMQGKPAGFKRGGRVMAGAEGGLGRLAKTKAAARVSKAPGKPAPAGKRP